MYESYYLATSIWLSILKSLLNLHTLSDTSKTNINLPENILQNDTYKKNINSPENILQTNLFYLRLLSLDIYYSKRSYHLKRLYYGIVFDRNDIS